MATTAAPSWNVPYARSDRWLLRFLPSLTDLAFLMPAFLLLFVLPGGLSNLLGDGDTGWHIRTGEWIVQHKAVPTVDIFSFTKPGETWFAWEWGWDVVFALIHNTTGLGGVVFVNLLILCTASALLFRLVRSTCHHDIIALVVTKVAVCASMIHWLARPHLLSWLFFLVLLHMLFRARQGSTRLLYWTPLLLALWTNFHGSFFVGILMLSINAVAQALPAMLEPNPDVKQAWLASKPFWICTLLSSAATFINPYTWHEHAHIVSYLRSSALIDQIQEFQTASFHAGPSRFFEVLLIVGLVASLWCLQQRRYVDAIAVFVWAHLALVAARNIPLFVFVASPSIACAFAAFAEGSHIPSVLSRPVQWLSQAVHELRPLELVERWHLTSLLAFAYFGVCIANGRPNFEAKFSKQFPESALSVVQRAHPARIFSTDQWGDFFLYHVFPSAKVFVDGRSDFYGPEFLERCRHILNARWDWETDLNRFMVDMVIVTPETPLATVLKSSPHWQTLSDDGKASVFQRRRDAEHYLGLSRDSKNHQDYSDLPIRHSAVVRNGRRQLGAVSACKCGTTPYERRCL
jgi:hypothetical protein